MNTAIKLLNAIADATKSTDRQLVLTLAIGLLVKSGMSVDQAHDAIFGDGAYIELAGNIYRSLRGE